MSNGKLSNQTKVLNVIKTILPNKPIELQSIANRTGMKLSSNVGSLLHKRIIPGIPGKVVWLKRQGHKVLVGVERKITDADCAKVPVLKRGRKPGQTVAKIAAVKSAKRAKRGMRMVKRAKAA